MSDSARLIKAEENSCGYCANGRIFVGGNYKNVETDTIIPLMQGEGITKDIYDLKEIVSNIEIARRYSDEIKCPVCNKS